MEQKILIIHSTDRNIERNFWGYFFQSCGIWYKSRGFGKRYPQYLRKQFWKEHTFWRDGYFACSVGNVSEEMLKKYIENQG